mmetsp:Transcript_16821/g.50930  ORF Transcript_16821/g.50930 Transcript_16821/m.50930 type:complete len:103 (-) Transcript_16821:99-407(-)
MPYARIRLCCFATQRAISPSTTHAVLIVVKAVVDFGVLSRMLLLRWTQSTNVLVTLERNQIDLNPLTSLIDGAQERRGLTQPADSEVVLACRRSTTRHFVRV